MDTAKFTKTISKMKLDKARSDSKYLELEMKYHELEAKHSTISGRFLSKQLEVMFQAKTKTWWKDDDVCKSMALLVKSKSAYQFLRSSWRIPLPSISTMGANTNTLYNSKLYVQIKKIQ